MLNQVVLVGRLLDNKNIDRGFIKLAVNRSYKNEEGIYETDEIIIKLNDSLLNNVKEYVTIGDVIGIKGRIEDNDGFMTIVADKVTFLSSKNN